MRQVSLSARSVSVSALSCQPPHFINSVAQLRHGLLEHQVNDDTENGVTPRIGVYHAPATSSLVLSEMEMMWSKDRRVTPAGMGPETWPVLHFHIGLEVRILAHQSRKDTDSSRSGTASSWI